MAQHINVLELLAFFNYLRAWSASPAAHGLRYFHIVDSRVCACVLAKGRSSSHSLNRILRRVASVVLAADLTVCPLWTISSWNCSGHGSRAVAGADVKRNAASK